jgi:SAM-dependent methyltransferase
MTEADENRSERFAFGRNWEGYVRKNFSEERLEIARRHLLGFLGERDLSGKRILDIGCGSGLHSLAAIRSGAEEVVSFDYDPKSVAATLILRQMEESPARWRVSQGSVLDPAFMEGLGQFDIVYAWGVLHHTGDIWQAFRQAAGRIAPRGRFYVALYTAGVSHPSDVFWLDVKRRYNRSGRLGKKAIEAWFVARHCSGMLRAGINPLTQILGHRRARGMSYFTDVRDWVGGWPMQFSSIDEVTDFARALGLDRVNIKTGEANTEYLFAHAER